jgi:outer membrane protein assembly factor BamB
MFFLMPQLVLDKPAPAKEGPKRHFTSQESHKRREELKSWKQVTRSKRRVSVKKLEVTKLKKSTFWNKKPFQFSTPVISGGVLYIGVDAGVFYALDAEKLNKIWEYKTAGPVQSPAAVSEGVVYFGDADGHAYALSAADGREIWKIGLESPIYTAPLPAGDRVYFAVDSSQLFALHKSAGTIIWGTDPLPKPVGFSVKRGSSPVLSGDLIMFGNSQGMLMAYTGNGNLSWARQLGDRQAMISDLDSRPLVEGGCVYAATADRNVFCVDPRGGNVLWSIPDLGGANDIVLSGDKLFVSGGGVLSKVEAQSGTMIWDQDLETPEISSPAISGNIVAVVSTKDKFYLIDPDTGDIIYDRFIRGGSFGDPLFMGDHLYILSNSSRIYAFKIKEKTPKAQKMPKKMKRVNKNKSK